MRAPSVLAAAAFILLLSGCASLPTPGRAGSASRAYLSSEEGRAAFPGAAAGEPVAVRDGDGEGFHAFLVPFVADGMVVGYGELLPGRKGFSTTRLPVPRRSLLRVSREQALRWSVESTRTPGPFFGATVEMPHLIYREPRGYSWAVRFLLPQGGYVVYSGESLIAVAKAL